MAATQRLCLGSSVGTIAAPTRSLIGGFGMYLITLLQNTNRLTTPD